MSVDWKSRLLETTKAKASFEKPLAQVVQQVVADGHASLAEVKSFLAEHKDVFGDKGEQAAKKAAEALLDSTSPKMALPSSSTTQGMKAHALRFDPAMTKSGALPWFATVQLTAPPVTLVGKGEPVVVDGERFTAQDVAALLKHAA